MLPLLLRPSPSVLLCGICCGSSADLNAEINMDLTITKAIPTRRTPVCSAALTCDGRIVVYQDVLLFSLSYIVRILAKRV